MVRAMLIGIATAGFFVWGFSVKALAPSEIVISKVQISGGTGLSSQDFVTIINKSSATIDLKGLRLVKRTKTGTVDTTIKSWTSSTPLAAGASYTWANSADGFADSINADTSSTQTIANDNGVALREGAADSGIIIDSLAFGAADNAFVEGLVFPQNPAGGQYLLHLNNQDTNNNANDFILFPPATPEEEETETNNQTDSSTPAPASDDLFINELFVNPKGVDSLSLTQEFIELHNRGKTPLALDNWRIEIGDIVFPLPAGTIIAPGGFTSLRDPKNIVLPNKGETIKLFAPEKTTALQSVSYKEAPDGMSYAYFSGTWRWTALATPDKVNQLAQAPRAAFEVIGVLMPNVKLRFDSSDSFTNGQAAEYLWDFGAGKTSLEPFPEFSFDKNGTYQVSLAVKTDYGLSKVEQKIKIGENKTVELDREKEVSGQTAPEPVEAIDGADFTTAGTVVVKPGVFGVQYFYLLPEYGEPLIEIYNSKKLFPKLKIGDQVIVSGEYTEREQGPRLKIKEAKDVKFIGEGELEIPVPSNSTEITKPPFPRLASVTGEIVSKKSPRIYLADETGEIEIYLSKNTGLKISDFEVGKTITVKGVLTLSNGTVRLQPRYSEDIITSDDIAPEAADFTAAALPISSSVLGEEINQKPNLSNKNITALYLAGGAVILIGALLYFGNKKSRS